MRLRRLVLVCGVTSTDQRRCHRRRAHGAHHQPRPCPATGAVPQDQRRYLHGHDQPRLRHGSLLGEIAALLLALVVMIMAMVVVIVMLMTMIMAVTIV